jgi:predicted permease
LSVAVTVAVGLVGFYATRKWVRKVHGTEHSHNEIVGFYLGAVCLFYGITLGLIAVGTWEVYSDVENKVGEEASALAALYRDVSSFPEYTHQVIDVAWPQQRRGIIPQNSAAALMAIQTHLASFEPATNGQKTLHAEAYREFDRIVELRRNRLRSAVSGLPAPLWVVVLVGAFISIALTWFFDKRSRSMHFWMTVMFSGFLGLQIFLLAIMDNPFRGEISVGPEAFELVYEQLMKPLQ